MNHPPPYVFNSYFVDNGLNYNKIILISIISTRWQSRACPFVNPPRELVTRKAVAGRPSKPLKVQGHEGVFCFFFKPERKMNPTLCNCIIYTAVNR